MVKEFAKMFLNKLQAQAVDVIIDASINALAEYRRANKDGQFDLHRLDATKQRDYVVSDTIKPFAHPGISTPKVDDNGSFIKNLFKF